VKKGLKKIASQSILTEQAKNITIKTREYCLKSNQTALEKLDTSSQSNETNYEILRDDVLEIFCEKDEFCYDLIDIIYQL